MRDDTIKEEEVRLTLGRVLADREFAASPRICALLRYIVEEALAGRADRLKAFTIATVIYGRGDDFDAQSNPLIRVEALRMRRALARYFTGPGQADPIEIAVPRGGYAPLFTRRGPAPDAAIRAPEPPGGALAAPGPARHVRLILAGLLGLAILTAGVAGYLAGGWPRASTGASPNVSRLAEAGLPPRPTIHIGPFRANPESPDGRMFAETLTRHLEDALSRFDNPVVVSGGNPAAADYQLSGELSAVDPHNAVLGARVTHGAPGEVIWSRTFDHLRLDDFDSATASIAAMTGDIGHTLGVVYSDIRTRMGPYSSSMEGFTCVALAHAGLGRPTVDNHRDAMACLDHTIAKYPTFSSAFSARALLLVSTHLNGFDVADDKSALEGALDSAATAIELGARSSNAYSARFWARLFSGQIDGAFADARKSTELNPYSSDVIDRLGAANILRGRFAEGVGQIESGLADLGHTPGWLGQYLFLAAHVSGDDDLARRRAAQPGLARHPLGLLARIISASETGDQAGVARWRAELGKHFPGFARDVATSLDRWAMDPKIKSRLLADIDAAGGRDFSPPP